MTVNLSLVNWLVFSAFGVAMATAAFWLVQSHAPFAASSGLPEIKSILGGFIINQYLSVRTGVIKLLALCLAVGSGLSIGREVPIVHIAGAFASLSRVLPKYKNNLVLQTEMLSIASATGFAVAFGAPLSGLLFTIENLSTFYSTRVMVRSFWGCLVACVTV